MKPKRRQKTRSHPDDPGNPAPHNQTAETAAAPTPTPAIDAEPRSDPSTRRARRAARIVVALILICATWLTFKGLGGVAFWDDEADVAIISRNYLATGELTGWDGRNLYAQYDGTVLDKKLRIINPPLMYWLTAASFKAFGASTWAGRFPFAVCGLLTLAAFALLLRHDFTPDGWLWLYALGGLGLSPIFLLYNRQCRYYALVMLFGVLFYYGYRRFLATRRWSGLILLTAAAVGHFYANYLTATAFILAVGTAHLVFHRRAWGRREWLGVGLAGAAFLALTVPYAIAHQIWVRPDHPLVDPPLQRHLTLLWWNFRDLNRMGALAWPVGLGLGALIIYKYRVSPAMRRAAEWALVAAANLVFIALLSPQETLYDLVDFRYMLASLPLLIGITGVFLAWLHGKSRLAAIAVFVLLLTTNLLQWSPLKFDFRWVLPAYLHEINNDYPTCYSEAVQFIQSNVSQDERVLAIPKYHNYPLMFYTGERVRFCSLLDDLTPMAPDVIAGLDAPLLMDRNFPDWIFAFGYTPDMLKMVSYFSRPHRDGARVVQYSYQMVRMLDVFCDGINRPEFPCHSFGPIRKFDRKEKAVYVFKRAAAS